jgi:hypothetical protein
MGRRRRQAATVRSRNSPPPVWTNTIDPSTMMEFAAAAFAVSVIRPMLTISFVTNILIILDLISDIAFFCL